MYKRAINKSRHPRSKEIKTTILLCKSCRDSDRKVKKRTIVVNLSKCISQELEAIGLLRSMVSNGLEFEASGVRLSQVHAVR